jgi:hypothetical protein
MTIFYRKNFVHFDSTCAQLFHLSDLVQQPDVDLKVLKVLDGGSLVDDLKCFKLNFIKYTKKFNLKSFFCNINY